VTITIHTGQNSHDLLSLIRDLQLLDGGGPHRVRRAVHGSGAIVDDELALMWLTLTTAPSPEFLESLIRVDPKLEDLVGRRASDAALRELYLYLNEPDEEEVLPEFEQTEFPDPGQVTVAEESIRPSEISPPGKKAPKSEWESWAVIVGLLSVSEAETATKAQLQALISYSGQSAPDNTREG
jgi:hypothetical protein